MQLITYSIEKGTAQLVLIIYHISDYIEFSINMIYSLYYLSLQYIIHLLHELLLVSVISLLHSKKCQVCFPPFLYLLLFLFNPLILQSTHEDLRTNLHYHIILMWPIKFANNRCYSVINTRSFNRVDYPYIDDTSNSYTFDCGDERRKIYG